MFEQLPETLPHRNKRKLETFGVAIGLQAVLIVALIIVQMAMPEKLGEFQLITTLYMAPPPPPPAAPVSAAPEPVHRAAPKTPTAATVTETPPVRQEPPRPIDKEPAVIAPTTIPHDIARIVESAPPAGGVSGGVPGGVRGGAPGGLDGGVLGGILGGAATPPPPPPLPSEPVRVGGNVKPPKVVHIEQPHYPPAAKKAGVEGVVVVEATVTADGTVEKVKVISSPPMLGDAAAEAVSHWKYEPTYLNGQAVPVILTARISFSLSDSQK
jgi:protein TonB